MKIGFFIKQLDKNGIWYIMCLKGMIIMSLLKNLLKREVNKQAGQIIGKIVNDALGNNSNNNSGSASSNTSSGSSYVPETQNSYDDNASYSYSSTVRNNVRHDEKVIPDVAAMGSSLDRSTADYFDEVIRNNMPGYTTSKRVPASSVISNVPSKNVPIDVVLYSNGKPVLAIFVVGKNRYRNLALVQTMNACEASSIPAIRFFKEFENRPDYVMGRVKAVKRSV